MENEKNTSYASNNVTNYALYLINTGLVVGSKIIRNYGRFKTGNKIFEVTDITDNSIKAKCVDIIKPSISQSKKMEKEMS